MKTWKDGAWKFGTNEVGNKFYIYNMNGMGPREVGVFTSKEDVLKNFPKAEFESFEEAMTCSMWNKKG